MTLEEAKQILNTCTREELRDHAFGDVEVGWMREGKEVAGGYFGNRSYIYFHDGSPSFGGEEAKELRRCGKSGKIERNDSVGPSNFVEGRVMPELTLKGVLEEITGKK